MASTETETEDRMDYLKNANYLIKVSNNKMTGWDPPSTDQEEFMNLYIKFYLNTLERNEYDEVGALAWAHQNTGGRLQYTMCRYLNAPINRFEFPFGFYRLLSNASDEAGYKPRIIFVCGIEPKTNYLEGNKNAVDHRDWIEYPLNDAQVSMRMRKELDMEVLKKVTKRRNSRSFILNAGLKAAASGGKKTKKKRTKKKPAKKKSAKKKSTKRKK